MLSGTRGEPAPAPACRGHLFGSQGQHTLLAGDPAEVRVDPGQPTSVCGAFLTQQSGRDLPVPPTVSDMHLEGELLHDLCIHEIHSLHPDMPAWVV